MNRPTHTGTDDESSAADNRVSATSDERSAGVPIVELREQLSAYINQVARGRRVRIMRRGKPVAYIIPVDDMEAFAAYEDALDLHDAQEALQEPGPSIPLDEVLQELGLSRQLTPPRRNRNTRHG